MTHSLRSLDSIYLPSAASTSGQVPLSSIAQFDVEAVAAADFASRSSFR